MDRSSWERALARAVTDRQFCARLLADPAGTLVDYGLSAKDRPLVDALRASPTLAQLAAGFLHLAATAWAQPASASPAKSYVEDPFLSPYPTFGGNMDIVEPWISNVLLPLDQLPYATPNARSARGGDIRIKMLNSEKDAAGKSGSAASRKRRDIHFYRKPTKPSRRPTTPTDGKGSDDVVNF